MVEAVENITEVARKDLSKNIHAETRCGVSVATLMQLFRLSITTAYRTFELAIIRDELDEKRLRVNMYQRGAIQDLLSEWNSGRPFEFPKRPLLTTDQAAVYLTSRGVKTARATLETWRSPKRRKGPAFVRVGEKVIRYRKEDLDEYVKERSCTG